jgi:hypothetical protein
MVQIVDFKQAKEQRERERRKQDPKQQALKQIADQHPEWGPKELEELHQELEAGGSRTFRLPVETLIR